VLKTSVPNVVCVYVDKFLDRGFSEFWDPHCLTARISDHESKFHGNWRWQLKDIAMQSARKKASAVKRKTTATIATERSNKYYHSL